MVFGSREFNCNVVVNQFNGSKDWLLVLVLQMTKEVWNAVKEMYSYLENISQSFKVHSKIRNT